MDKSSHRVLRRDLTQGSVVKKLLLFALPLIASNLIMQFYNVADSVIVGQFVGKEALAAVGASFPAMFFFNALFMGVSTGAGIAVSQYFGAKNFDELKKVVSTTFTLILIFGSVITVVGLLGSRPLLSLIGTPSNIIDDTTAYLTIIFVGTIGNMIYAIGSGILRGLGDSKWPLYFLILSSVLNIILDIIFVAVFGWNVPGVAWATIISHVISGILIVIRLNTGGYGVRFSLRSLMLDRNTTRTIIRLGLPTGIQMMTMSLGMMVIQSFANRFGSDFIAANNVIMRTDGFAILPMQAIGMAVTTFVGQNIGAGKTERAKRGINTAALIIFGIGIVMGLILWFFGVYVIRAFTPDPDVLEIGERGIKVLAFVYCFMGLDQCFGGAMRGAGAAIAPMVTGLIALLLRIPIAYFLAVVPHNYMGLFYAMAMTMILSCTMIFIYYKKGNWRNKGIAHLAPPPPPEKFAETGSGS